MDPRRIFGERAEEYAKFRPRYPREAIDIVRRIVPLVDKSVIADLGSGTGIFSESLIDAGYNVIGIEPDRLMRQACIEILGTNLKFSCVDGSAEATGLPPESVDAVTAAQSFHWFDPMKSRVEIERILKVGGQVILLWNERRSNGSLFLEALDRLLNQMLDQHGGEVSAYDVPPKSIAKALFGQSRFATSSCRNRQVLNKIGFIGRVMSSSYAPVASDARFGLWRDALEQLYLKYRSQDAVTIEYDTVVIYGSLA